MFTSEFNERSRSNPLCDFRLGTVATSDHETPLTGYEPKKDLNLVNTEELDLAATSDVYWQHTLDDDASLNDPNVDDNQLAKYLAVVVDSTGKPVEMRSNNDQFSCDTRNLKSAQSQFPVVAQPEMICQTGGSVQARIAEERENAHAQIRTMLDEQRRTIIAECNEKVLHHELLAAHAEQDRKVLQEELLRQQQEFREVHQQDLMKHLELQKFQNSAFDEFTQKKFIEDQKTIMELTPLTQAREVITKVRLGIGPDLDSLIARVGALRVRNTKIENYLKIPSLSSCKQIREATNAKKRRGSSGEDVKDEGRVLHHSCWTDDLYAMAGTMNHLTRILEDKTNVIERLGMRWKEKSLTLLLGRYHGIQTCDTVEIISNGGVRWIWRVVEGLEALGTSLDNRGCSEASMWHRISKANSMFHAKKALFCDPKTASEEAY